MNEEERYLLEERIGILEDSNVPDAHNKALADQERQRNLFAAK